MTSIAWGIATSDAVSTNTVTCSCTVSASTDAIVVFVATREGTHTNRPLVSAVSNQGETLNLVATANNDAGFVTSGWYYYNAGSTVNDHTITVTFTGACDRKFAIAGAVSGHEQSPVGWENAVTGTASTRTHAETQESTEANTYLLAGRAVWLNSAGDSFSNVSPGAEVADIEVNTHLNALVYAGQIVAAGSFTSTSQLDPTAGNGVYTGFLVKTEKVTPPSGGGPGFGGAGSRKDPFSHRERP